jgi:hypothetical protein
MYGGPSKHFLYVNIKISRPGRPILLFRPGYSSNTLLLSERDLYVIRFGDEKDAGGSTAEGKRWSWRRTIGNHRLRRALVERLDL